MLFGAGSQHDLAFMQENNRTRPAPEISEQSNTEAKVLLSRMPTMAFNTPAILQGVEKE
jgi:hypothetical protein